MSNIDDILNKILELSRLNCENREEALRLAEIALKEFPESKKLHLRKAFLLSHIAWDQDFGGSLEKKESMLNEAAKIYERYIDDEDSVISSNANMYLTQMMSIRGDKKALLRAEENYKKNPNTTSANRLYGVCLDLGYLDKAKEYFDLYLKHEKEEGGPAICLMSNSYNFYKTMGEDKKAEEFMKKGLDLDVIKKEEVDCQEFLRNQK